MNLQSPEVQMFLFVAISYFFVGAVSTMPSKDAAWGWRTLYGWFYDFTHILVNVAVSKRPALAAAEAPQPAPTQEAK